MLLAGCGTAVFDPGAYQTAVQLKYETLTLVDRSGERYTARRGDAEAMLRKYAEAGELAAKIPNNQPVADLWQAIRDPRGGSAGTLIQLWKDKGPLKPGARAERRRAIAAHFDRLICLEAGKQAAKDCGEVGAAPEPVAEAASAARQPPRRPANAPKPAEAGDEPPAEEAAAPPRQ